jgi:hypothetical protein
MTSSVIFLRIFFVYCAAEIESVSGANAGPVRAKDVLTPRENWKWVSDRTLLEIPIAKATTWGEANTDP